MHIHKLGYVSKALICLQSDFVVDAAYFKENIVFNTIFLINLTERTKHSFVEHFFLRAYNMT